MLYKDISDQYKRVALKKSKLNKLDEDSQEYIDKLIEIEELEEEIKECEREKKYDERHVRRVKKILSNPNIKYVDNHKCLDFADNKILNYDKYVGIKKCKKCGFETEYTCYDGDYFWCSNCGSDSKPKIIDIVYDTPSISTRIKNFKANWSWTLFIFEFMIVGCPIILLILAYFCL